MSDARELAERYSSAIESSHLQAHAERCDVDYLIAAGLVREGLGAMLYRLAVEWGMASGEYRKAMQHMRQVEAQATQIHRNAAKHKSLEHDTLLREAAMLLAQAKHEATTAKVMALVHMKTLREARDAIGAFARKKAVRVAFSEPDRVVNALAGKALQLFLDATCSACSGRGFSGGFTAPIVLCTACGASGKAHYNLSRTERHSAFIRSLLAEMDLKCHRVQQQMNHWLRQQSNA